MSQTRGKPGCPAKFLVSLLGSAACRLSPVSHVWSRGSSVAESQPWTESFPWVVCNSHVTQCDGARNQTWGCGAPWPSPGIRESRSFTPLVETHTHLHTQSSAGGKGKYFPPDLLPAWEAFECGSFISAIRAAVHEVALEGLMRDGVFQSRPL